MAPCWTLLLHLKARVDGSPAPTTKTSKCSVGAKIPRGAKLRAPPFHSRRRLLQRLHSREIRDGYLPVVGIKVTLIYFPSRKLAAVTCNLLRRHNVGFAEHWKDGRYLRLRLPGRHPALDRLGRASTIDIRNLAIV